MTKLIYQPVKPFKINQRFGDNRACVDLATNSKYITCDGKNPPEGYKSVYGERGHSGLDLAIYRGQPIYCVADGIVSSIDTNPRTGLDVRIITEYKGKRYLHWYEHLQGHNVKVGDKVGVGDCIGWGDNTGYSSGDHLHLEFREEVNGQWVSIDPLIYMENGFALDVKGLLAKIRELMARVAELLADKLRK